MSAKAIEYGVKVSNYKNEEAIKLVMLSEYDSMLDNNESGVLYFDYVRGEMSYYRELEDFALEIKQAIWEANNAYCDISVTVGEVPEIEFKNFESSPEEYS